MRIQHPIFTAAYWAAKNPVLLRGEVVYESDTGRHKVGDGVTSWNDLKPAGGGNFEGNLPAYRITVDSNHRFVTDVEKTAWNDKADKDLSNVTLAKSLTSQTSGYYKAPDGLMLAWGRKAGHSSGNHTIYFPVAFLYYPTAIICTYEWATNTGLGALSLLVKNRSTTQFEVVAQWASENQHGMSSESFFWLAIGRWK